MPKASFAKEDLYAPSGRGFVETVGSNKHGEVVSCVSRFVQWQANKTTGAQQAPLTSVFLGIAEINAEGVRIAEPVEQELVTEWGPKDGSMVKVRPGLADTRDGDAGDTVDENGQLVLGTEGNCLFVEEGVKVNMNNAFGRFIVSCQEKGFKPQILGCGFLPDFVGMRAWFDLKPGKKKDDGTSFNDFVVDSITRYPYEPAASANAKAPAGKKAPAAKAPAPAPAAASKPNGVAAAAAAPAPPAPAPASADTESLCVELLKEVSNDHAASQKFGDNVARQRISLLAVQKAMAPARGLDKAAIQSVQKVVTNKEWFETNAVAFGALNAGDDVYSLLGA